MASPPSDLSNDILNKAASHYPEDWNDYFSPSRNLQPPPRVARLRSKSDRPCNLLAGGFMPSKFAIGDQVDQAFSNHARGTVVAVLKGRAGERRYAVEMFGHRTIQIATESSLVPRIDRTERSTET